MIPIGSNRVEADVCAAKLAFAGFSNNPYGIILDLCCQLNSFFATQLSRLQTGEAGE